MKRYLMRVVLRNNRGLTRKAYHDVWAVNETAARRHALETSWANGYSVVRFMYVTKGGKSHG